MSLSGTTARCLVAMAGAGVVGYLIGSAGQDAPEHQPAPLPAARQHLVAPPPVPPPQATPAPTPRGAPASPPQQTPSHWSTELSRNGGRRPYAQQPPAYRFRPPGGQRGTPQGRAAPLQQPPAQPWDNRYAPSQTYAAPQAPQPATPPYYGYDRFRPMEDHRRPQAQQQIDPYRPLPQTYDTAPYAYDPRFPQVR